jgi:hypothetical protein
LLTGLAPFYVAGVILITPYILAGNIQSPTGKFVTGLGKCILADLCRLLVQNTLIDFVRQLRIGGREKVEYSVFI